VNAVKVRLVAGALALTLVGCIPHPVSPARTFATYEGKAVTTAESAQSAVETVMLSAGAASRGNSFGPFVSVVISEQEEALSGVQGTFDSVQPPDQRSDDLRDELDRLLSSALGHVADVRVAARRGQLGDLKEVATPLVKDADALASFIDEHDA
jgi:hypothetical protein